MRPDDPRHGTNAGAVQHWRNGEQPCEPCSKASRRLAKICALDRHRGNPRTVSLGERAHEVITNTPRDQLARASGLTVHKLCRLDKAGPSATVHRTTRDRILAAAALPYWTPVGIQRRLRALHAVGWSMRAFAAETDMHEAVLRKLCNREQIKFVRRAVAEKVIEAYAHLCMTPRQGAGATRARNTAQRNGWHAPLAWDDIDHDKEPEGTPVETKSELDPIVVERIVSGDYRMPATDAERIEVIRIWQADGLSNGEIVRRTGWNIWRYLRMQQEAS